VDLSKLPRKERIVYDTKYSSPRERHKAISRVLFTLYDKGYFKAEADSAGGDSLDLIVHIHRGNKFKNAQIRIGNLDEGMMPNAVFRDKLLYNEPFSPQRVSELFKKIIAQYENNGYPFAAVKADSVKISDEQLTMSILVDKGPAVTMDSIVIRGNANVKRAFLQGYLGIKPGSVYSEKQIKSISNKLRELPFITIERPHQIMFSEPEKAKVIIYAKKVNASRANGLIGFMPGSANGKLLVTGEVDLGLWNALGYGEQVTLKWRRIQAGTQSLNAYVKYPYLFGTPLAVNGSFDFYRRDSTFQNITFGFGIQYLFVGTSYVELFYRRQIAQVIDVSKFANSVQLPEAIDFTANNIGIKFNFESYDYRWNPTSGYLINGSVWGGAKNMKKRSDIPETLYDGLQLQSYQIGGELKVDYFIRLHKRVALKPGITMAHSENPYRFLNELYRVGGISNLRGFDEDAFFISSYAFGNMELRYLIEKNSNVYLFVNGGWAERDIVTGYFRDNPYGFGAGINFFTKAGFINFAYALGSTQGQPIQFRNGKIHLGFTGVF
jgi:translocation and assembly module TamA